MPVQFGAVSVTRQDMASLCASATAAAHSPSNPKGWNDVRLRQSVNRHPWQGTAGEDQKLPLRDGIKKGACRLDAAEC
jgi:hypothetical protein